MLLAILATGGLLTAWWVSRYEHDPRLVGQWSQAVPAATIVLERNGDGTITDQSTGTQTPIRWWTEDAAWWTEDAALYVDYDIGGPKVILGKLLARVVHDLDYRRWSIEALEADGIKLGRTSGGGSMEWQRIKSDAPSD